MRKLKISYKVGIALMVCTIVCYYAISIVWINSI